MAERLLRYGIQGERLLHVDEVANGLACGCLCPCCGAQLIARHGKKLAHSFAHIGDAECAGAQESAIHKFAKQALQDRQYLWLPALQLREYVDGVLIEVGRDAKEKVEFDRVEIEPWLGGYRPDAVAWVGTHQLLIEFRNTHEVDVDKRRQVVQDNQSMVEIDIRDLAHGDVYDPDEILLKSSRSWVHHVYKPALSAELERKCEAERLRQLQADREERDEARRQAQQKRRRIMQERPPALEAARELALRFVPASFTVPDHLQTRLVQCGLWRHVARSPGNWSTATPSTFWVSRILEEFVLRPADQGLPPWQFSRLDVLDMLLDEGHIFESLCGLHPENADLIRRSFPGFRRPDDIVGDVIKMLLTDNVFVESGSRTPCLEVNYVLLVSVRRGIEFTGKAPWEFHKRRH